MSGNNTIHLLHSLLLAIQSLADLDLLQCYKFLNRTYFYEVALSSLTPDPKPGIPEYAFDLSGIRGPANSYATASHTQDHLTTQAPTLRQSRHTFWGITVYHLAYTYQFKR